MATLSEVESKRLVSAHGVPVPEEQTVATPDAAIDAARMIGYPVVAKLSGAAIAHKTERGLVKLGLADDVAVHAAAAELLAAARPEDGPVELLIAPMVRGGRELIAGLAQDPQFGRCVMLGLGGIFAEAVADVVFRLVPITRVDAQEMIEDLATQRLLGEFRGEAAVDRTALESVLLGLSSLAGAEKNLVSADLNPIIVQSDGAIVAVDALVELEESS